MRFEKHLRAGIAAVFIVWMAPSAVAGMIGLTPVAINGSNNQGWVVNQVSTGGFVIVNGVTGASTPMVAPTGVTNLTPLGISGNGQYVTGWATYGGESTAFTYNVP